MAVTLYAAGPPGEQRPAVEAVQEVIARRGGLAGPFRITLTWTGVAPDADAEASLSAVRRAVRDARAAAFLDAGVPNPLDVVALLNAAGVPVIAAADEGLREPLCTRREPYPSGRRTAAVPPGATEAERARAGAEALFDALAGLPAEFDRAAINAALLARLPGC